MATFYRDTNKLNNSTITLREGIYDQQDIKELKNTSYININPNIKVTLYNFVNNAHEMYIYSNDNNAIIVKTNYNPNINYETNKNINLFEFDKLNIDKVIWNDNIGKVKIETYIITRVTTTEPSTTEPTTTEPSTTEPTTTEPTTTEPTTTEPSTTEPSTTEPTTTEPTTTKGSLITNYVNNTSSSQNVFQKNQTLFIILIVICLLFIILFILYKFNIMPFTNKNKYIIKNKFKNMFKK